MSGCAPPYYDDLDLLSSTTLKGGKKIAYAYDAAHRLQSIAYTLNGQDVWSLENTIDPYGNIGKQTITGSYIQDKFDMDERIANYTYDFRHQLLSSTTEYSSPHTLTQQPERTESLTRDFYVEEDYDAAFYSGLPDPAGDPKRGMDYLDSATAKLIRYYPDLSTSEDATRTERFALDGEGRSLTVDFGRVVKGVTALRLFPDVYEGDGTSVEEKRDYEKLFERVDEYNLVLKALIDGAYTLVPSKSVAGDDPETLSWTLVKDLTRGIVELAFSERIDTERMKLYCLIDERSPEIRTDAGEEGGLIKNSVAREGEDYFQNDGTFINSAQYIAEVEYILDGTRTETFTYDANGNRETATVQYAGETNYEEQRDEYEYYPNTNRLANDGECEYEYDADGNLTKKHNAFAEYRYTWNLRNQLSTVELRQLRRGWESEWESFLSTEDLNTLLVIFEAKYDEAGRRYWKRARQTDGSFTETSYAYTAAGLLYEKTKTGTGTKGRSYIYAGGKKLAQVEGTLDVATVDENHLVTGFPQEAIRYLVTDQVGSTRLMVNETGDVTWYGEYRPFGETSFEESADGSATSQKYTSYTRDMEIGLDYAMARYYAPELGRFISEDPAEDGENWYAYVQNNPLAFTDPTGENPIALVAAAVFLVVTLHGSETHVPQPVISVDTVKVNDRLSEIHCGKPPQNEPALKNPDNHNQTTEVIPLTSNIARAVGGSLPTPAKITDAVSSQGKVGAVIDGLGFVGTMMENYADENGKATGDITMKLNIVNGSVLDWYITEVIASATGEKFERVYGSKEAYDFLEKNKDALTRNGAYDRINEKLGIPPSDNKPDSSSDGDTPDPSNKEDESDSSPEEDESGSPWTESMQYY